jgi:hypothetical protein
LSDFPIVRRFDAHSICQPRLTIRRQLSWIFCPAD